jgi:hypothetical protein
MSRRVRRVVLVIAALAIVGAAAAVLLVRPDLESARDLVDTRWVPLRGPLAARYTALEDVAKALDAAGAGQRAVTKDLDTVLARWSKLALHGPAHTDAGVEATTANELEALARRVKANNAASARLNTNPGLQTAIGAFDLKVVEPPMVEAYNRAVRAYEDARGGFVARLVAGLLGYEARPVLIIGG